MRKKTKIGTRFGVRHQHATGETFAEHTTFEAEVDGLTTEQEAERRARVQLARCRKQKRGCKFVRAVSYRLAPLVELPAWRPGKPTDPWPARALVVESGAHGVHAWVDVDGWGIGDDPYWGNASIMGEGDAGSLDEASAACEERLRELGYRVAKAKKGVEK